LRFSENLLDEEVNLGDISTASFGSPLATPLPSLKILGGVDLPDDPTITQFPNFGKNSINDQAEIHPIDFQDPNLSNFERSGPSLSHSIPTELHCPNPVLSESEPKEYANSLTTETPTSKKKKIKVNVEVERIVVSHVEMLRACNGCDSPILDLKVQDMVHRW
jgi:hypothetical protein